MVDTFHAREQAWLYNLGAIEITLASSPPLPTRLAESIPPTSTSRTFNIALVMATDGESNRHRVALLRKQLLLLCSLPTCVIGSRAKSKSDLPSATSRTRRYE